MVERAVRSRASSGEASVGGHFHTFDIDDAALSAKRPDMF